MTAKHTVKTAYHELKSLGLEEEDLRRRAFPYSPGIPDETKIQRSMERYQDYRAKWQKAGKEYFLNNFPLNVDIELSSLCNLRCRMCNWGFDPEENPDPESLHKFQQFKRSAGSMSFSLFKAVIDEVVKENGFAVKLNWRGEPIINQKIGEMIKYAKEQGVLEVLINTNAALLTDSFARKIIDAGLDQIIFSIDSLDKNKYEQIRRGAVFERTLANILNFIDLRNKNCKKTGSPKPLVKVQMVVMDDNRSEVEFFNKFFSPLVDMISTQDYTNRGEKNSQLQENLRAKGRRACPQIWQRLIITWDGQVGMCCRDWDFYHPLGNLDYPSETISHFWNGEKLAAIRKLHQQERLDELSACHGCTYKESYKW
jgi:MoaA/NifB/PqqE/SkfB family radical SAM enzyme